MASTMVYRDYDSFRRRPVKGNGISVETLMECHNGDMARAMADNATNDGCWDCVSCRDCKDCFQCYDSTGCTDCRNIHEGRGLHGADMDDLSV